MRPYFGLLFLHGLLCNESPLRITPSLLIAWKGSCMLIPCHVGETLYSERLNPTGVIWYFKPFFDQQSFSYTGQLLYDSSKTAADLMNLTSSAFRDRVRFVGDLSQGDCSLKITELHPNHSGMYGVVVAASVGNKTQRQMLYRTVTAHVRESPPKPKIETVDVESQEWWTMKVACSVVSHCPDEIMTLTFVGLEETQQKTTVANGMLQTVASVEPMWKDKKDRKMTCILSVKDGSMRSKTSVEVDGSRRPEDVQLIVLNDLPVKEGHDVTLNCSVGRSFSDDNWYNWVKSDTHTAEIQYSRPKLLTFPATPGPAISYQCEACNRIGCTLSQKVSIDVHFSPKEVKILKWAPQHILEGAEVKLKCDVGMANPSNLTYIWYRGEERMARNSSEEMLIFSSVSSSDSGDYRCEVSNTVGTTVSSEVTLCVLCE